MAHVRFSVSFLMLADPALCWESSSSSPPSPAAGPALVSPGGWGRWAQNKVWQEGWRRSKPAQAVLCSSWKVAAPRAQAAPTRREYLMGKCSSSHQVLAMGAGRCHSGKLPSLGSGQKSLCMKTSSQRHLAKLDGEGVTCKTTITPSLLVPCAGQGELDRQNVGLLLPPGADTPGCSCPDPWAWQDILSSWLWSQVVIHLNSSFISGILSQLFGASQSGCAWHPELWEPFLQLRHGVSKEQTWAVKQHNCFAPALAGTWSLSTHLTSGLLRIGSFLSACKFS